MVSPLRLPSTLGSFQSRCKWPGHKFSILLAFMACQRAPGPAAARTDSNSAVATVGGQVIDEAELRAQLSAQGPHLRAFYLQPAHKRELLDQMIREELLAQEASRRGLDQAPEVRQALRRALAQQLSAEELARAGAAVSDADLRAFYAAHLGEFVAPERVRLAHVVLADKAGAEQLLSRLRAAPQPPGAFAQAARESLDHATSALGGDLRFQSRDELEKGQGKAVADAAFAATQPGALLGPLESPAGWQLLRYEGRQPPVNRAYAEVEASLRKRVEHERQAQALEELVGRLRAEGAVKIDDEKLKDVSVPVDPAGAVPFMTPPPAGAPSRVTAPAQEASPR